MYDLCGIRMMDIYIFLQRMAARASSRNIMTKECGTSVEEETKPLVHFKGWVGKVGLGWTVPAKGNNNLGSKDCF